jgi:cytochrome b561
MDRASRAAPSSGGYDAVARAFHWLTALLIGSAALLGLTMTDRPAPTEAAFAELMRLYSIHKTIGVAALFVALARIGWALSRPRPGPLHPERRAETALAAAVHWSLYGAMIVMPVSGWLYSSTAPGYAPIWLPVWQTLPFVPPSEALGDVFRTVHVTSSYVLYGAFGLHLAGVFRHAIADMDATMARMTTGTGPLRPERGPVLLPAAVAGALWAATVVAGVALAPEPEQDPFEELGTLEEAPLE